ncbi:MAG: cation:proton antiporter [Syntrophobacteraceae bacterium]|nr:cation:proton antiporter [Syntrophobacteraceae bacterium]
MSAILAKPVGQCPAKACPKTEGEPSAGVYGFLALLVSCAAVGRFAAGKLKQAPVLGELAAGILVGALLYQLGSPTVIIIRHSALVEQAGKSSLTQGLNWPTTVRSTLRGAELPEATARKVTRVLLSRDFLSYISLARSVQLFAGFGVVMLLFMVGLEVSLKELRAIGRSAAMVAASGVVGTFVLSFFTIFFLLPPSAGLMPPLFVGAALCASSIGITARIFKDLQRVGTKEAHIVLGAAVLDDILGLLALSVASGVAVYGGLRPGDISLILLKTALFLGAVVVFGSRFVDMAVRFLAKIGPGNIKLLFPFVLLMLLSWLASRIGLAAIIGAFTAGVLIKEESFAGIGAGLDPEQSVVSILASIEGILAPIFFVLIGLQVDLVTFLNIKVVFIGLLLTGAASAGKLASSLGAPRDSDRLTVGIGMLPRVEVPLIVASMGKALGVLNDDLYSVIVMVVVLTVVLTPPLLKWSLERKVEIG